MAAGGKPVLWQYNFSNFNEKVRWALDYKRAPHVRHSLVPGSPRALWLSMRGTVPVLDLDGERIVDSTRIIEALERRRPDPPLYPAEEADRRRALELEDFFDEDAGHELRRAAFYEMRDDPDYITALLMTGQPSLARRAMRALLPVAMVYANRRYRIYPADAEEGRRKVALALDRIEAEVRPSGYLVGDGFTVADLTAAALLFPVAWPPELQYDYPEPPRSSPWLESLTRHPAAEWITEIYRRHRGVSAEIGA
jgi:glutathione S-transferase